MVIALGIIVFVIFIMLGQRQHDEVNQKRNEGNNAGACLGMVVLLVLGLTAGGGLTFMAWLEGLEKLGGG